jgi:hypothetical protein
MPVISQPRASCSGVTANGQSRASLRWAKAMASSDSCSSRLVRVSEA